MGISESIADIGWSATRSGIEIDDDVGIGLEEIDLEEGCEHPVEGRGIHIEANGIGIVLRGTGGWIEMHEFVWLGVGARVYVRLLVGCVE